MRHRVLTVADAARLAQREGGDEQAIRASLEGGDDWAMEDTDEKITIRCVHRGDAVQLVSPVSDTGAVSLRTAAPFGRAIMAEALRRGLADITSVVEEGSPIHRRTDLLDNHPRMTITRSTSNGLNLIERRMTIRDVLAEFDRAGL